MTSRSEVNDTDLNTLARELDDLEQQLKLTNTEIQKEISKTTPTNEVATSKPNYYLYLGYAAVPVLTFLIFYFMKPKFVLKDQKKKTVDYSKLGMYVGGITIVLWVVIFALNYYKLFDNISCNLCSN